MGNRPEDKRPQQGARPSDANDWDDESLDEVFGGPAPWESALVDEDDPETFYAGDPFGEPDQDSDSQSRQRNAPEIEDGEYLDLEDADGMEEDEGEDGAESGDSPAERRKKILVATGILGGMGVLLGGMFVWMGLIPLGGGGSASGYSASQQEQIAQAEQASAPRPEDGQSGAGSASAGGENGEDSEVKAMEQSMGNAEDGKEQKEKRPSEDREMRPENTENTETQGDTEGSLIPRHELMELIERRIAQARESWEDEQGAEGKPSDMPDRALIEDAFEQQARDIRDMGEAVQHLQERVEKLQGRISETGESAASVDLPGDLQKDLDVLTQRTMTALANSRIALERTRGSDQEKTDWREIRDANEGNEGGDRPQAAQTRSPSSGDRDAQKDDAQALEGWKVIGIGGNEAMVRSPRGSTYLVSPGDRVPNAGRVLRIEPHQKAVVTDRGRIEQG